MCVLRTAPAVKFLIPEDRHTGRTWPKPPTPPGPRGAQEVCPETHSCSLSWNLVSGQSHLQMQTPLGSESLVCVISLPPQPILEERVISSQPYLSLRSKALLREGRAGQQLGGHRAGLGCPPGWGWESPRCETESSTRMEPFSKLLVILALFPDSSERQPRSVQICREH